MSGEYEKDFKTHYPDLKVEKKKKRFGWDEYDVIHLELTTE